MRLVLASASPRRTAILDTLGLPHEVDPADVDESLRPGESAEQYVKRLAEAKAAVVAGRHVGAFVLAGDTTVVRDDEILGKPADDDEAVAMLCSLAGRQHRVLSGLALAMPGGGIHARVDEARVFFRSFDASLARAYVATGEPVGKAGAYAIQGQGGALVTRVEGDYSTVVGLSIAGLVALLEAVGQPYRFQGAAGA
jgi:septum formation protein